MKCVPIFIIEWVIQLLRTCHQCRKKVWNSSRNLEFHSFH